MSESTGANGRYPPGFYPCSTSSAARLACLSCGNGTKCDRSRFIRSLLGEPGKTTAGHNPAKKKREYHSLAEMRYMNRTPRLAVLLTAILVASHAGVAQAPTRDPAARLKEVLPPDVAQRVLGRIADARAHNLPAEALENRALKFAAKGVNAADIERSVNEQATRMQSARSALAFGRGSDPAGDEIEAGAEAMRKGVSGAAVSLLAKSAPSGRSLAVPLFVIGSLTDRGLSSDQALQRVLARLQARASDADIESMPGDLPSQAGRANGKPAGESGRDFGQSHRPASAGRPANAGPPAGVPGNGGNRSNSGRGHKPPPKTN